MKHDKQTGKGLLHVAQAHHNGYAGAAAIPDTPMSPPEEQQGYSPNPNSQAFPPSQPQGMCCMWNGCLNRVIMQHHRIVQTTLFRHSVTPKLAVSLGVYLKSQSPLVGFLSWHAFASVAYWSCFRVFQGDVLRSRLHVCCALTFWWQKALKTCVIGCQQVPCLLVAMLLWSS